ncbi:MAG: hypothetical protein V9E96_16020 [Chitinophagaceae bacterium]
MDCPILKNLEGDWLHLMLQEEVIEVLDELYKYYDGIEIPKQSIELINYHENCPI